ncbi:MAG: hypothetical protein NVSMB64_25800 [Candidatus Velthaea sp.]
MPRVKTRATTTKENLVTAKPRAESKAAQLPPMAGSNGAKSAKKKSNGNGDLGFEATLWFAADTLRGLMDASEHKHPVLGLIFLKYISDAFEEKHALVQEPDGYPEDRDEYTAENIFWVPPEARRSQIAAKATLPQIGEIVDKSMTGIERDNPRLRGGLPKEYAKLSLGSTRLGAIVDLVNGSGLGNAEARRHDVIGRHHNG